MMTSDLSKGREQDQEPDDAGAEFRLTAQQLAGWPGTGDRPTLVEFVLKNLRWEANPEAGTPARNITLEEAEAMAADPDIKKLLKGWAFGALYGLQGEQLRKLMNLPKGEDPVATAQRMLAVVQAPSFRHRVRGTTSLSPTGRMPSVPETQHSRPPAHPPAHLRRHRPPVQRMLPLEEPGKTSK